MAGYRMGKATLAARPGFEPRLTAPKADVLPLHYRAELRKPALLLAAVSLTIFTL